MRVFKVGVLFLFFLMAAILCVPSIRNGLLEKALEAGLNAKLAPFFHQTIDLQGVHLDKNLKIKIQELRGIWKTPESSLPIQIQGIQVKDPVTHFVFAKPVRIAFSRFRPLSFEGPGVNGEAILRNDKAGNFELKAQFLGLDLDSLTPLNPENLKGASGRFTGDFHLDTSTSGKESFTLNLKVMEPGGQLQAKFFDLLLPYLPTADQAALAMISQTQMIHYKEADLKIRRDSPDAVKLLLHILVPDYNLNLNLNVTVRVEDQNAFFELAKIFGLINVEK